MNGRRFTKKYIYPKLRWMERVGEIADPKGERPDIERRRMSFQESERLTRE